MEIRILGPVEADHGGLPIQFPRRQQRVVLGVLAMDVGRVVQFDRLVDLLWGERPPARARAVLHSRVSELRALLGAVAHDVSIPHRDGGYLLDIAPAAVDAHRLKLLVEEARHAPTQLAARDALRAAVDCRLARRGGLGGDHGDAARRIASGDRNHGARKDPRPRGPQPSGQTAPARPLARRFTLRRLRMRSDAVRRSRRMRTRYLAIQWDAMGMYASARGWLQMDFKHRSTAEEVVRRHHHDLYSGGWAFPAAPFNWTLYLFYGGDVREAALPWLREQITELAAMPPVDDDGDRPVGLFLITDERGGAAMWQVRDGCVDERPATSLSWLGE